MRWCKREHVESNALNDWKLKTFFQIIDKRTFVYSKNLDLLSPKPNFFFFRYLKQCIQEFLRIYVLATADKFLIILLLLCDDFFILSIPKFKRLVVLKHTNGFC